MKKKIIGYKAFESDMTCRGKQYAENTTYEEPEAKLCESGMHFCENPFDVLKFYTLVTDNGDLITTAEVEPQGEVETDGVKSVTTKLRINAKLSFGAFIKAGIDFLIEKTKKEPATTAGDWAKIGSAGNWAKIGSAGDGAQIGSAGYWAQIGSAGDGAKIGSAGDGAKIGSAGDWAKIGSAGNGAKIGSAGDGAQIGSAGNWAKIGSAGYGAQIGSVGYGAKIGSAGNWAQIGSAGYGAQIGSAGDGAQIGSAGNGAQIISNGQNSVIVCAGHGCAVRAKAGSWITLSEWGDVNGTYKPICVKTEYVDGNHIKADTLYMLKNGKFVECTI